MMNRRDLLTASGAVVPVGISGCIDEFETAERNVSEDGETEDGKTEDGEPEKTASNDGVTESRVRYSKSSPAELPTEARPPAEKPPDAAQDTVSPRDYPAKPTEYTDQSIQTFVESHERAYRRNGLLARWGSAVVSQGFEFDWTVTLNTNEGAGIGRCQYRYNWTTKEGDDYTVGDSATIVVTYYVDDSMIVRAEDTGRVERRHELAPDPWESGVILEPAT